MKEELRRGIKRPLNGLFLLLGIILMTGLFVYVHTDQYETFEIKNKSEAIEVDGALLPYQIVNSDEGDAVYQNLLKQKSVLARQLNSVLFNQPKKYISTSQELTNLRLDLRNATSFEEELSFLQPSLESVLKDEAYYTYLAEQEEEVILKPESIASLTILFLTVLGVIWFPICAFLTANILEDEYEHTSLIKGQPQPFMKRMMKKFSVLYLFFVVSLLGAFLVGGILTQLLGNPVNDLSHVNAIQLMSFVILKNWQIICAYFIYMSILFLFVFTLSVLLNIVFRNFYLTLIIELAFYGLTILLPDFIAQAPWYIGSYIVPSYLFNGNYLTDTSSGLLNPVVGSLYLLVASGLLSMLASLLSKRGLKGVKN